MEDETGKEVIFESWLFKLSGTNKRRITLGSPGVWNRRYFVLERNEDVPSLLYYTRKPNNDKAVPKGHLTLSSLYRVEKRPALKGKSFVCRITTENKQLVLATDEEKIFHILVFFVQTQIKIKDEIEEECFVVRPDNTEDQRCLGARGNMSLLHVSASGITLSLQLSKCVVAQWPLKCIKFYESTGMGQFGFETGRQSPSGEGKYFFNTRHGQDDQIFDRLDKYVMEADAFKQIAASRLSNTSNQASVMADLDQLDDITWVCSDARFMSHLKRISRDIYDNLAAHLGGSRAMISRNQSDPDLLSDTLSHGHTATDHDRLCSIQDVSCASSHTCGQTDLSVHVPPLSTLPSEHYVTRGATSDLPLMKKVSVDSQYLHMANSCNNSSFDSTSPDRCVNDKPPTFYEVMKLCNATNNADIQALSPGGAPLRQEMLVRQQSRSCEDFGAFQKMEAESTPMSYENQTFVKSDELAQCADFVYSYASPLGTRGGCVPSAKNQSAVTPRIHHQEWPLPRSSRRSLSNPDIFDGVDRTQLAFASSRNDIPHRPSPFNFKLIKSCQEVAGMQDNHTVSGSSGNNVVMPLPAVTPSPKSALSVISPAFLKGSGFTEKSKLFVKRQPDAKTPPGGVFGNRQDSAVALNNMEGRRLPTIPDSVVKETSC